MRKIELSTIGIILAWIIVIIIVSRLEDVHAQDTPIAACYQRTDAGAVFIFSNVPDEWFTDMGWYYIGDAVALEDNTLTVTGLQFDEGYSYAVIGRGDYSENMTAATDLTPLCVITPVIPQNAANDRVEPFKQVSVEQVAVVSSGRTCTVKYPEIILVCTS